MTIRALPHNHPCYSAREAGMSIRQVLAVPVIYKDCYYYPLMFIIVILLQLHFIIIIKTRLIKYY